MLRVNSDEAKQELKLWFDEKELHSYKIDQEKHHGF